jgi:hypothetical protein
MQFDGENPLMTRQLADEEKNKAGERNEPVKGDDIFVSKAMRTIMNFEKKDKAGKVEKSFKGSKKRREMEVAEQQKKEKQKKKDEKLSKLEVEHSPEVVAAIKKTDAEMSELPRKKQKSKLYFKMKRDKAQMKKLKTQLTIATAAEASKRKRRVDESEEKGEIKILDEENDDVLEEEDILDIYNNGEDSDQDEYDDVAYGEQAQEPPKKLAKLSAKLEKRIENEKIKRGGQTSQERAQERQNEMLRQKVIENYKRNRKERSERRERGEAENHELNALRRFAANKNSVT